MQFIVYGAEALQENGGGGGGGGGGEESYLPRICRPSSLNLHTFHLIDIVFWWRIFFRKHGKSISNDRRDHHILVTDVVIMTSQCRCTRALSQSHVVKHDKPRAGDAIDRFWEIVVSPTCLWKHKDTK